MKILQVTDLYPPVLGGLELAVKGLSETLAARGNGVTVVTQAINALPSREEDGAVAVHRVPAWTQRTLRRFYEPGGYPVMPPVPDPRFSAELRQLVAELDPDVIHTHGWASYSVLALRRRRARVVVGLHDYGHVCPKRTMVRRDGSCCAGARLDVCVPCAANHLGNGKGLVMTLGLASARRLHRRADGFIANSSAVLEATRPVLPHDALATVIAPSAPTSFGAVSRRPAFLPARDGYILFVGALGAHKGIDVLLAAHRQGELGAPLVIIGTRRHGPPPDLPADVILAETVPHAEVLAAFEHCSLAVVPSVWPEPFGMVAVEAMAAGRPVIASAVGGLQELVVNESTGLLVPPGDAAALAAAIRSLIDDQPRRLAMGQAAAHRAAAWSSEVTATKVEAFYRQVVAGEVAA